MRRRRSLRLRNHDYRQNAVYFVTICTHKAECLFGDVVDGEIMLSTLGNIANDEWLQTAKVRSYVELDAYVVMPNHIHGIICIFDESPRATHRVAPTGGNLGAAQFDHASRQSRPLQARSLGAIVGQYKAAVTRRIRQLIASPNMLVWQRGYYDSILQNERILHDVRSYIAANPERWVEDKYYVRPR